LTLLTATSPHHTSFSLSHTTYTTIHNDSTLSFSFRRGCRPRECGGDGSGGARTSARPAQGRVKERRFSRKPRVHGLSIDVWDHTYIHTRRNGRRRVEVLQHSVLGVCVCVAMFSETTGAMCPSHNKYIHVSPAPSLSRSPRSSDPTHRPFTVDHLRRYGYGRSSTAARPFRRALCRSIENAILLYCTHTRARILYIQPLWRFNRETTTFRPSC